MTLQSGGKSEPVVLYGIRGFQFSPDYAWLDREGNLFISDESNLRIRKVNKDGIITTFAGTGKEGYSGDGGPATKARLTDTGGITFDAQGNLRDETSKKLIRQLLQNLVDWTRRLS